MSLAEAIDVVGSRDILELFAFSSSSCVGSRSFFSAGEGKVLTVATEAETAVVGMGRLSTGQGLPCFQICDLPTNTTTASPVLTGVSAIVAKVINETIALTLRAVNQFPSLHVPNERLILLKPTEILAVWAKHSPITIDVQGLPERLAGGRGNECQCCFPSFGMIEDR